MDLDRCSVPGFDTVRGDRYSRELEIDLFAGGEPWQIPAEAVTSVTMGGEVITVQVYDSTLGMVIIPSVTGDVVIR